MITSTQIANIGVFTFVAVVLVNLLSHKFLFINIKDNRNC